MKNKEREVTASLMHVIDSPVGPALSKKALMDLGITSKDFPYQQKISVNSTGEAEAAKVTTEWGARVSESPESGISGGNVSKKTRSEKLAARLERLKEDKRKAKMLQTSVQPLNSLEIPRGQDLADSGTRDLTSIKRDTASKEGSSEVAGSSEDVWTSKLGGNLVFDQEATPIFHPSPGAGKRSMDNVSTGESGSLTNVEGVGGFSGFTRVEWNTAEEGLKPDEDP